jgi:hypothetical protein
VAWSKGIQRGVAAIVLASIVVLTGGVPAFADTVTTEAFCSGPYTTAYFTTKTSLSSGAYDLFHYADDTGFGYTLRNAWYGLSGTRTLTSSYLGAGFVQTKGATSFQAHFDYYHEGCMVA